MNENRQFFIRGLVGLMNNKFWNTVVESLLIRLCMTCRVDWSRTTQAALAVQFRNATQLQLIFMSAAMSIRSLDSEHFISDMTSYFPSNPFRTISCIISVMDVCTDCEFRLGWGCRFLLKFRLVRAWLQHRERRPHLVSEHQFSWCSTSRAVWSDTVLLEEFSQSQMFRLLLLSHSSFHGLLENTHESFRFPIRCWVKWRRG